MIDLMKEGVGDEKHSSSAGVGSDSSSTRCDQSRGAVRLPDVGLIAACASINRVAMKSAQTAPEL